MTDRVTEIGEFVATRELVPEPMPDFYGVRERGKMVWLQRLCFRVLKRLGKNAMEDKISVVRHVIDHDKILDRIWEQKTGVMSFFHQGSPHMVLMGAEDFQECLDSPTAPQGVMEFAVRARVGQNGLPAVFGLKIVVVPWIKGVVVVPPGYDIGRKAA